MDPKINFWEYNGNYKLINGKYHYGTLEKKDYITYEQPISIINPSFDNSFKLLFSEIIDVDGMRGKKMTELFKWNFISWT